MKTLLNLILFAALFGACNNQQPAEIPGAANTPETSEAGTFIVHRAATAPVIDGLASDACWQKADWHPLDQRWIGEPFTAEDFQGRYKLSWNEDYVFILAEIVDDTLIDIHEGQLDNYWNDDCLELFVDEDRSKGNHQFNYNAFAYHISLDYVVADLGPDSLPHYFNDHITTQRSQNGKTSTWEVAMKIFDDSFQHDVTTNVPVKLSTGKKLGFAMAYCDNDHSPERENFIGSVVVEGEDKNRGWIDAGIFGELTLQE